MNKIKIGFALCGSFCTFSKVFPVIENLTGYYDVFPIMSAAAAYTDTRFGVASEWRERISTVCGKEIITTISAAEPIGPKKLIDALVITPCTGNTLGKLAAGITDSSVTMAAKANLRNGCPVLVAVSTNDGLTGSAQNIGKLLNSKGYYFVPFSQDSPTGKPASLVAHFELIPDSLTAALEGRQIQPIVREKTD